ncbi:MAG: flagellar hook-length control protein FliK [Pseudomonadota bacterium]
MALAAREIINDVRSATIDGPLPDVMPGMDSATRTVSTTAPTSAIPAGAETARHVAIQVAEALRQGSGTFEITLSPEELGRVRLSVGVVDGAMLVNLSAERPETLDLMRRHIDMLQAEARAEGFATLSFSFSGGDPGDAHPPWVGTDAPLATPDNSTPIAAAMPTHQPPQAGLDLRL